MKPTPSPLSVWYHVSSVMLLNPEGLVYSRGSAPISGITKQTESPDTEEASLGLRTKLVPAPPS